MKTKDRLLRPAACAFFLLVALAGETLASAPALLTYQGRLKESGLPVTGARSVDIQICDALTAGTCTPTGAQGVSVVNGLFRTTFTVPSGIALESGNWFIEVHVGASVFSPREMLSAGAYAIYSSSASTLIANPGASYVAISTPVNFAAQDAAGFSVLLSSGLSSPAGTVKAKYFIGDGSGLTGLPSSTDITKVLKSGDSMTGPLNLIGVALNLTGAGGSVVSAASVTASSFWGDGSHLTGVAAGGGVLKTGDGMTGPLTMLGASTITVSGSAFSVGVSSFVVSGGSATVAYQLTAGSFVGNGAGLTGLSGTDSTKVAKTGDTMTGQLTNTSTVTILGNAFSVGGSTFVVAGGLVGIGDPAPAPGQYLHVNTAATGITGVIGITGPSNGTQQGFEVAQPVRTWQIAQNLGNFGDGRLQIYDATLGAYRADFLGNGDVNIGGPDAQANPSFTISTNGYATIGVGAAKSTFSALGGLFIAGGSSLTLSGAGGYIAAQSSVTASSFFGDGSHLTGVSLTGGVLKAGDGMTGSLTMLGASTIAVQGGGFSVSGSSFIVTGGNVGIGTPSPAAKIHMSSGTMLIDGGGAVLPLNPMLTLFRGTGGGGGTIQFGGLGNTGVLGVDNFGEVALGSLSGALHFHTAATNGGTTLNNERMRIDATGNVGVGTALPAALLDVNGNAQFGSGATKSTFTAAGGLFMAGGSSITLSGPLGVVVSQSSVTAGAFYGDASHLTGLGGAGVVLKAGDGMTGPLTLNGSTLTVTGSAFSVGGSTLAVVGGRVGVGTAGPSAALDVQAGPADSAAAVFRNASGVAIASVTAAGVFAGTQTWNYTLYDPQGIQTGDNIPAIVSNRLSPLTIVEVWCESDDATAAINLHRTGSAFGTNVLAADLTCGLTGTASTNLTAGENVVAYGATVDHLTQSVTLGAAKRINVVVKYILH